MTSFYGNDQIEWMQLIVSGYSVSAATLGMLVIFELLTWDQTWRKTLDSDPKIWSLYKQGIVANAKHFLLIGPVAYVSATMFINYMGPTDSMLTLPGVLLIQAIGYACMHALMHNPSFYWMHKFHHQYSEKTFVRPISANSVTASEFFFAYALPIVVGTMIFRPNATVMFYATMSISLTNLFIHTPSRFLSMKWMPSFLVTNEKHFHHHEKNLRKHYSAPILDLDSFLGLDKKATE